eukprot:243394_1
MMNGGNGQGTNSMQFLLPQFHSNSNNNNTNPPIALPPMLNHNNGSMNMQAFLQSLQQSNQFNNHQNSSHSHQTQNHTINNTPTNTTTNTPNYNANVPPNFYPFGPGNSMTLMADMVPQLNNADKEIFRGIMDKFNIFGSHLVVIQVQPYRDSSEKSGIIKIPSKPPSRSNVDVAQVDILNHPPRNSIPAGIRKQRLQTDPSDTTTTNADIIYKQNTAIKDSGLSRERYEEILGLIVNHQSVNPATLEIVEKDMIKMQNNLFCNGLVTLGKHYDYEYDTGKRFAMITKQIENKDGVKTWKKVKKSKEMDAGVFKMWVELTNKYNDEIQKETDEDSNDDDKSDNINDKNNNNRKRKRKKKR